MQEKTHLRLLDKPARKGKVHTSRMKVEQHRAARRSFVARVVVVDINSEKELTALTSNLSVFGCFIETAAPFPRGTKIRVRISHRGTTFTAVGQVANARANGMGVRFDGMEPAHQQILENWLAAVRSGQ